ncbi:protein enabled-like [Physeter macrocephalus]|uniref:Protein enabled-like n=1 Tax=Physeter macrocephalus TaxID=9755 RepID=A0A455CA19_PHYMC|nr:protein enabled-like [Physeter catodon]|eukprot:XP_028353911.1 protein enabled-like [Physeter catodon]
MLEMSLQGRRRLGGLQGAAESRPGAQSPSPSQSGAGEGGAKSGRRLCRRSRGAATLAPRPPALTRTHTRAQEAGGPGPTGPPWTPPARGAETPASLPSPVQRATPRDLRTGQDSEATPPAQDPPHRPGFPPNPTACHSLAPLTARPPWGAGHGVKGQVLRRAPWVLGPRAWVAGGGWPVGVPGGPACPPQSLGVLEGILDGIKVNGTEAKQGGVWVRPRGEQVMGLATRSCQLLGNRKGHLAGPERVELGPFKHLWGDGHDASKPAAYLCSGDEVLFPCGRELGTSMERCPF